MKMESAKKLASKYLNVGISRIKVSPYKAKEIKESITGEDIKALVADGTFKKFGQGQSSGRAKVLKIKKQKGRRRGPGTRKGTHNARVVLKKLWLIKVKSQRRFIKSLLEDEKIDRKQYRNIYRKVKGGFFRNKNHIKIYLNQK